MSQFLATLRRRPAPLAGTFVALTLAAVLVTMTACLTGTGLTLTVPAQRLAGAAVVVTGNQNIRLTSGPADDVNTDVLALPAYRRVSVGLARRLAAVPGVTAAVPDLSIALGLQLPGGQIVAGSATAPLTGHGWQSASLTPFTVISGHAPASDGEIVIGAGLARATGLRPGDTVRLAGQDLPPFTVAGVAAAAPHNPATGQAVFFTSAEAAALYGHPGQADLIGVIAAPGTSAATLAARIRAVHGSRGLTVLSGARRGQAEELAVATEKLNLWQLATSAGFDVVLIALFVVAGTVALSVAQRWRNIALLRAVGATPGQIRRMMVLELAILGAAAGLAGFLPGAALASWAVRGLAAHQLIPPSTHAWTSPWVLLIASGTGMIVAQIAGFTAARRAGRMPPAAALQQANAERRWPHLLRILLGLAALGGGVALCVVTLVLSLSPLEQINLALGMLLAFMAAVALLGPLLVSAAEFAFRLPARLLSPAAGRLAMADIRMRPRRMASAVASVALAVTFTGAIYLIDATQAHAAAVQGRQRLAADAVVFAPGPGLAPGALAAIKAQPGVATAVGLTPATVFVPYPGNDNAAGEAVTPGHLNAVLDLKVISGSLSRFGPGDIALSKLVTGRNAVDARVGQAITVYLADGSPYRAKVTAIYARSLGFGDVIIPASAGGGGHLGTASLSEILVRSSGGVTPTALASRLTALATRFAGLHVASRRAVVNAQAKLITAQSAYANYLLLGVIAILAAVALVNTLVMATVERRESLRLLRRVGATTRQMLSMTGWQTLMLGVTGITLGAAAGAASILVVSKVLTGTWAPYTTWPPIAAIVSAVLVLIGLSIFVPTTWILAASGDR